jgi:hypothetical protein
MPFGKYKDFDQCVRLNQSKDHPEAYCAAIERAIKGDNDEDMNKRARAKALQKKIKKG